MATVTTTVKVENENEVILSYNTISEFRDAVSSGLDRPLGAYTLAGGRLFVADDSTSDIPGHSPVDGVAVDQFGAVADGVDTYEGGAWHKDVFWAAGVDYEVGDIVQISGTPNISRMCIQAHTSPGTFANDPLYWVAGSFSGTDNRTAFADALAHSNENRVPVIVRKGFYYLGELAPGEIGVEVPDWSHMIIEPGAVFLCDEDPSHTTTTLSAMFSQSDLDYDSEIGIKGAFIAPGMTLRGRWSHAFNYASDVRGMVGLALSGFKEVNIDGFDCRDWRGNPTNFGAIGRATARNVHLERCASDGVRFVNSNNVIVSGGFFKDTSDDAIALHSHDKADAQLNTTNYAHIIENNTLIKAESIACKGAGRMVVSGNTLLWPQGSAISIGNNNDPEGSSSSASVIVVGNIVENAVTHWTSDGGWPAFSRGRGCMEIGGVAALANGLAATPGTYDATGAAVVDYWGDGTNAGPLWGNDWYDSGSDTTLSPSAPATGNTISGNTFARTTGPLTNFMDAGFGAMFRKTGWYNPAVTEDSFRDTAIIVQSDVDGMAISGNTMVGFRSGGAIFLDLMSESVDDSRAFKNIVIANNTAFDVQTFLSSSRRTASGTETLDVVITGNRINCDPFCKSDRRTSPLDGTWQSSALVNTPPIGLELYGWSGYVVSGNVYENCYAAHSPLNSATVIDNGHVSGELLKCEPVALDYDAGNKGIADIPPAGGSFSFMIVDSDPTSATWKDLINTCVLQTGAIPSSGTYVQGDFVRKQNPSPSGGKVLWGWLRITTGSGHVSGTDWTPVYGTTS